MGLQRLFRTFADSMGLVVTIQEDEDVFEDKRKILFDRGEGFEKNLKSVVGQEIGQDGDDEVVGGKDRIEV